MGKERNEDGISRRDFLEGALIAAGGAAVLSSSPVRALAGTTKPSPSPSSSPPPTWPCDGSIGIDPRVLRGGNLRDTFNIAHLMRDNRLTWGKNSVTVSASSCDTLAGTYAIAADTGTYDLIVVGGGISGLATAFFTLKNKPNAKILILENNPRLGGNASRDDASPALPVKASAAAAYMSDPYYLVNLDTTFLFDWYNGIGVEYAANVIQPPFYSYYFDSYMPASSKAVWNGTSKWAIDVFTDTGINSIPFTAPVQQDLHMAKQDFRNWYTTHGAPTDPPDASDPKYDYLAWMSMRDYLTNTRGYDPAVADFYDVYSSDSLACFTQYANAYSSIDFLGAEYNAQSGFPGGNSYIARRALWKLIPGSINGTTQADITNNPINTSALDKSTNQVRYRTGGTVLHATTGSTGATVQYYLNGKFYSANCKAVVLAGQMHTGLNIVSDLMSGAQAAAADAYEFIPVPVANVAVNNSQFLVNAGMTYDYYWYGSQYWQDCVVADYTSVMNDPVKKNDGTRPNVLSFYSGFFSDPNTTRFDERSKLLTTPFSSYEDSLKADMSRVFGPYGFDWTRDVSAVDLYRWGHGMVVPYVGWTFGQPTTAPNGQVQRTPGPRTIARQQIGRISFAGQDTEGAPCTEDATYSGVRASQEVSQYL